MYWTVAVHCAKQVDVSYEEWCSLYYNKKNPTQYQRRVSSETAYNVLLRNNLIEEGVCFIDDPDITVV